MRERENRMRVEAGQSDPWMDWVREETQRLRGEEDVIMKDFERTVCQVSRMTGASPDATREGFLALRREAMAGR